MTLRTCPEGDRSTDIHGICGLRKTCSLRINMLHSVDHDFVMLGIKRRCAPLLTYIPRPFCDFLILSQDIAKAYLELVILPSQPLSFWDYTTPI